jgi:hypothetical protein
MLLPCVRLKFYLTFRRRMAIIFL